MGPPPAPEFGATVERIAVVALIVILLNGGRDIGAHRFRRSLGDISSIGLVGTFATAGALAAPPASSSVSTGR